MVGVRVCLAGAYGEAGVEEEDALVGPRGEQAAVLGRRAEIGVFFLDGCVDVLEGGWSRGWRPDGEAQAVGLVVTVIGVLS